MTHVTNTPLALHSNASGDDDDEEGSEDTPSEDTDADGDVDGATRRDKAGGAPSARTRQSPRLAELEANGAAGTTPGDDDDTSSQHHYPPVGRRVISPPY